MQRSTKQTPHILIRASTTSHWDHVDFATVHLTPQFRQTLHQRFLAVQSFKNDSSFYNLTYWDSPLGYYCDAEDKLYSETITSADEDWAYIQLESSEVQTLAIPKNQLEAHQLMITKHGYANFKAYSKHTAEEYWTEWFSIPKVLNINADQFIDSS